MRIYILLVVLFCSCSYNKKLYTSNEVEIFDRKIYDDYTILYGKQNLDTVSFVSKTKLLKDCNWLFKFVNRNGLKPISQVITNKGDSLVFTHLVNDVNGKFKVTIGSGKPGLTNKRYISTYYNSPYLIENCESLQ